MTSTKPYLIRAVHEWCADHGFTPYLAVHVDEQTRVPAAFVREGQIVLNVSTEATHQLVLGNEEITFQTRFNGASFPVVVPVEAVAAIYARENGQGIAFEVGQSQPVAMAEEVADQPAPALEAPPSLDTAVRRSGHLTRVK